MATAAPAHASGYGKPLGPSVAAKAEHPINLLIPDGKNSDAIKSRPTSNTNSLARSMSTSWPKRDQNAACAQRQDIANESSGVGAIPGTNMAGFADRPLQQSPHCAAKQ